MLKNLKLKETSDGEKASGNALPRGIMHTIIRLSTPMCPTLFLKLKLSSFSSSDLKYECAKKRSKRNIELQKTRVEVIHCLDFVVLGSKVWVSPNSVGNQVILNSNNYFFSKKQSRERQGIFRDNHVFTWVKIVQWKWNTDRQWHQDRWRVR